MLHLGSSDVSSGLATITALVIKVVLLLGLPRTAVATTTATDLRADMPLLVLQLVLLPGNSKLLPVVPLPLLPLPLVMDTELTPVMPILLAWQPLA
jgi:hypothetical protein